MSGPDILIVADLASVHVRRLATGFTKAGLRVEIAGFEGDPMDGVRVHRLGTRPSTDDLRYLMAIPRLARLMRSRTPTIVHAHYVSSYGLMATLSARLAYPLGPRPGLVQTTWGTDLLVTAQESRLRRASACLALRSADLITGDSLDLEASAAALAPNVPFHRFVFGPDERLLTAQRRTERLVLSTRRLDPDTRVDHIVRAFRLAKHREPESFGDWRLVVAGVGSAADVVRAAAEGEPSIEFVGQLGPDELSGLLMRSSVFVSIPRSDATSAALLEAMAAGSTPLVNDLPANREWVGAEIGEIVPRDPDVSELAGAMLRAASRSVDPQAIRLAVRGVGWDSELHRLIDRLGRCRPGLSAGPWNPGFGADGPRSP